MFRGGPADCLTSGAGKAADRGQLNIGADVDDEAVAFGAGEKG